MSWESRGTVVNRLTKPPSNVHSCCNLVRTNINCSGVHATESSPYKVKDDKALCQGTVVVVVGSSFGRKPVIPSLRTEGPSDTVEQFTGLLNWEGGFVSLW